MKLRTSTWCGALLFAAEALPLPSVLLAAMLVRDKAAAAVLATALCYAALLVFAIIGKRRTGICFGSVLKAHDIFVGAAAAVVFYPSAVMLATAVSMVTGSTAGTASEAVQLAGGSGLYATVLALAAAPAVAEEAMVRGFLYGALRRRGIWPAVLITALCFGLLHAGPSQASYAFYCGIALGLLREATGGVWAGMAMHCMMNLTAVFLSMPCGTGALELLDGMPVPVFAGAGAFLAGAGFLLLVYFSGAHRDKLDLHPPFVVSMPGFLFLAGALAARAAMGMF